VAGCDAAEVFDAAEGALGEIASTVTFASASGYGRRPILSCNAWKRPYVQERYGCLV
jgi:hypothetical protein